MARLDRGVDVLPTAPPARDQRGLAGAEESGDARNGNHRRGDCRGRDGQFVPASIRWMVERSFAWLSRYRRLNTICERSKERLIAFVAIAFISILSRRLKRLVAEDLSA